MSKNIIIDMENAVMGYLGCDRTTANWVVNLVLNMNMEADREED